MYDFSPVRGETNWKKAGRMFKVGDCLDICISTLSTLSTISTIPQVDDYLTVPADVEMVKELGISHDKERSLIPLTTGLAGKG